MESIRFHLNGEPVAVAGLPPATTVLDYLRGPRGLTGTKEGCAEGDCGACTVVLLDRDYRDRPALRSVNACLLLLPMLHGRQVWTVEGLRGPDGSCHPAQEALVRALGSQCGYCTPGVVMTLVEACYRGDLDAPWKLGDQLAGTLCRCTGYRPIRRAARELAGTRPEHALSAALAGPLPALPPLDYRAGGQRFVRPAGLDGLWRVLAEEGGARLVSGATDLGLEVTKAHRSWPCLVSLEGIAALRRIERGPSGDWSIGAGVALSALEAATERALPPLARMLRYFGARQIKNRATVGGNLCNASPIGDLAPILIALGAEAVIAGPGGERSLALEEFFVSYRRTALAPGEILLGIRVPDPAGARAAAYKVSKRRELDISTVSAGMLVRVVDGVVREARLAYGGMAATPSRAPSAEAALVGRPWTAASARAAAALLDRDFTPLSDHRGSAWYRMTVARNLLIGFFEETLEDAMPGLRPGHAGTVCIP